MQLLLELWRLDRTMIRGSELLARGAVLLACGARWLRRFVRPPQGKE
jgi:hypothetical protein